MEYREYDNFEPFGQDSNNSADFLCVLDHAVLPRNYYEDSHESLFR